ncbi:MAG: hypothetical protein ABI467_15665 [Kofleriaceae bacterium]
MAALSALFDLDWRRISRWALLGVVVMLVWLAAPAAKCSFVAFRDIPLSDYDTAPDDPGHADRVRVEEGKSFFASWMHAIGYCYRQTPLLGQQPWKDDLLLGLSCMTVLGWSLHRLERRRKRTTLGDRRR